MWVDRSAVGLTSCISDPVSWTFIWKTYDALRALGIHVSQRRVGASMVRVVPRAQRRKRQVRRHLNPPPYTAPFYGDKVHFDQNEKMA